MILSDIMKIDTLENTVVEMKQRLNRTEPDGWLKTVAGFANGEGGVFYLGVEDKTEKLVGYSRKEADDERNFFNNKVNEHVYPVPHLRFSFVPYIIRDKERILIKVDVPESELKPVIMTYKGMPGIFMRRDGFTNGATPEEIRIMSIGSEDAPYDSAITSVEYDRRDFIKLCNLYKTNNNGRDITDKMLAACGFFNRDGMLTQGAVMFRDDYSGLRTSMKLFVFPGINRGSRRPVSVDEFNGNIIDSIQYGCNFIARNMNHTFMKLDNRRIDWDAYPARAVFEGVVNAVAHRDYWLDGSQIQIDMFRDRLEISSPGSFYKGKKTGRIFNLSGIISMRRNKIICEILVRCKMMEAAGTGFDKIMEEYKDADAQHKPYIRLENGHFTLVLPDLTYDGGVVDYNLDNIEFIPLLESSEYDERILQFCLRNWRTVRDISEFTGLADSSYLRKQILGRLADGQLLETRKKGRTVQYRCNRDNVRLV